MSTQRHSPQHTRADTSLGRLSKSASELSCARSQDTPARARSAAHHAQRSVVHRTQHFFTNVKSRWSRSRSRERCPIGATFSIPPDSSGTDPADSEHSTPANSPRHRSKANGVQPSSPEYFGPLYVPYLIQRDESSLARQASTTEPCPSTSGTPAHRARAHLDLLMSHDESQRAREQQLRQHAFFQLRVHLKRGQNLVAMDKNGLLAGTSDPYVKFKIGGRLLHKSKIVYRDLNPIWDETFTVPIEDPFLPVNIKVFDYDWGLQDDFMGSCSFDLTALELGRPQDLVLCLQDPSKGTNSDMGEIVMNVTLWPKTQEEKEQVSLALFIGFRT